MKTLILDIETAPLEVYAWALHENYVGLAQMIEDWNVLSWSAKWLGDSPDKIIYMDLRHARNKRKDKRILRKMWRLLDEAEVIITKNGKRFDEKKLNARFVMNGMQPPSSYQHIDVEKIARKKFSFTSNGLEYLSEKLCTKYRKLKHKKFPGIEMWRECMAGNLDAWREMEKYNKHDVLALEELYYKLIPWDTQGVNFNMYHDRPTCSCGSTKFRKRGFFLTRTGRYQRYKCRKCGAETRSGKNLIPKKERKSLFRP